MPEQKTMISLSDIADIETKGPTRHERISFRLKSLMPVRVGLDSWQSNFILSVNDQFSRNGDLSNAQFKTLLGIWQDAHKQNLVKLPKGMV